MPVVWLPLHATPHCSELADVLVTLRCASSSVLAMVSGGTVHVSAVDVMTVLSNGTWGPAVTVYW